MKIKEGGGNEEQLEGGEKISEVKQEERQILKTKERGGDWTEEEGQGKRRTKWGRKRRQGWMKNRTVEKSERWRERGRDGEPLIIYDSLSFSKQPSGPAPCFPLTFNLSENQQAWSLIIVSVCQRLCFNLPDTEVRSQAVRYTHVSQEPFRSKQSSSRSRIHKVSQCKASLNLSDTWN